MGDTDGILFGIALILTGGFFMTAEVGGSATLFFGLLVVAGLGISLTSLAADDSPDA